MKLNFSRLFPEYHQFVSDPGQVCFSKDNGAAESNPQRHFESMKDTLPDEQ